MLTKSKFMRPHHVMEALCQRMLYPSHYAREPERQPDWVVAALKPLTAQNTSYESACAQIAWGGARTACARLSVADWKLPKGMQSGEVTMSLEWPQHPFIDLSRGSFRAMPMADNFPTPVCTQYRAIGKRYQGEGVFVRKVAVQEAFDALGYDWGVSIEGKPVSEPPQRQSTSQKGRLQKALLGKLDCELGPLTGGDAQSLAHKLGLSMARTNVDEVLNRVKHARGLSPNQAKGT